MTRPAHPRTREERTCARPGCDHDISNHHANTKYCDASECRRARKRHRELNDPEWVAIIQHDPCAYCGVPHDHWKPTIGTDHIVPVGAGGPSTWDNLTACCQYCNSAKHNHSLLDFLLGLSLEIRRREVG